MVNRHKQRLYGHVFPPRRVPMPLEPHRPVGHGLRLDRPAADRPTDEQRLEPRQHHQNSTGQIPRFREDDQEKRQRSRAAAAPGAVALPRPPPLQARPCRRLRSSSRPSPCWRSRMAVRRVIDLGFGAHDGVVHQPLLRDADRHRPHAGRGQRRALLSTSTGSASASSPTCAPTSSRTSPTSARRSSSARIPAR